MRSVACAALVLLLTPVAMGQAYAAPVSLNAEFVNRLISAPCCGTFEDTHFDDYFSTYYTATNWQNTLSFTSTGAFLSALTAVLGPAPSYSIISATLSVGSDTDDYVAPGQTAHRVAGAVPYDTSAVTWNSFNGGGVSGTDYLAAVAATGSVSGNSTVFDLTSTVRGWLDGSITNTGLYFWGGDLNHAGETDYTKFDTTETNVRWTLDAEALTGPVIPEPASLLLVGAGLAGLVRWRKRRG